MIICKRFIAVIRRKQIKWIDNLQSNTTTSSTENKETAWNRLNYARAILFLVLFVWFLSIFAHNRLTIVNHWKQFNFKLNVIYWNNIFMVALILNDFFSPLLSNGQLTKVTLFEIGWRVQMSKWIMNQQQQQHLKKKNTQKLAGNCFEWHMWQTRMCDIFIL